MMHGTSDEEVPLDKFDLPITGSIPMNQAAVDLLTSLRGMRQDCELESLDSTDLSKTPSPDIPDIPDNSTQAISAMAELGKATSDLRAELVRVREQLVLKDAQILELKTQEKRLQADFRSVRDRLTKSDEEVAQRVAMSEVKTLKEKLEIVDVEATECRRAHAEELVRTQEQFLQVDAELAEMRAQLDKARGPVKLEGTTSQEASFAECARLNTELFNVSTALSREKKENERSEIGHSGFLDHVLMSSGGSILSSVCDLDTTEILGAGSFGYLMTCADSEGRTVCVKLMTPSCGGVASKEWVQGSSLQHPNIVEYFGAYLHRDVFSDIASRLDRAFDDGVLSGTRPMAFPAAYFCLVVEFMKCSVQDLLERRLLAVGSAAAVTRQVASALSYMHRHRQTHNDVRPANIVLSSSLVVKLADSGLSAPSVERLCDFEHFGSTVWCMTCLRDFDIPAPAERETLVAELRQMSADRGNAPDLRNALADAVQASWREDADMQRISEIPALQSHEVTLPRDDDIVQTLARAGKQTALARANEQFQHLRRSC